MPECWNWLKSPTCKCLLYNSINVCFPSIWTSAACKAIQGGAE